MADLIGQRLGQYEITAPLGRGGMAAVYRARQATVRRDVAIKVIEATSTRGADFIKRFEREAQTAASLNHPHILKVFDYGQHEEIVYLVMELHQGGSLADKISSGPLPLEIISVVLDQIASALDYAHSRGVIHRDLKPQNVLLDEQGNTILSDFGIAKLLGDATSLTQSGVAIGTPSYMPPEQWQGKELDARADTYALGVMLFEMVTGQLPFKADTPVGMMYQHLNESPPPVRDLRADLPPGVQAVIRKALAKKPQDRFASTRELAMAFKAAVSEHQSGESRWNAAESTVSEIQAARRRPGLFGVSVVIVALLLIGGLIAILLSGRQGATTSTPTLAAAAVATSVIAPTWTQALPTSPPPSATLKPTSTSALSSTPTIRSNPQTRAAQIVAERSTMTANAIASFTRTPTAPPTTTPNEEQTAQAIVAATDTAVAVSSFTKTPTPTFTPTVTLTTTPTATPTPNTSFIALSNLTQVKPLKVLEGHTNWVFGVAFSPDGSKLVSCGSDDTVRLWNTKSGQLTATIREYTGSVYSVAFSPDGNLLASGGFDKVIWLWPMVITQAKSKLEGHRDAVLSVAFSPDGTLLASGSIDKTVRLWNIRNPGAKSTLVGHNGAVQAVAFNPDGTLLATGSTDKTVRLWDVKTGQSKFTLQGHMDAIGSVAFNPAGTLLASGSADKTIRLWDVRSGQLRATLEGHTGPVNGVAFSPDGTLLASGSNDNTVRLWDIQSRQAKVILEGHTNWVFSVAFSPDGKFVASGSRDENARLWGLAASP